MNFAAQNHFVQHLFAVDAKTGKERWHYTHVIDPAVSLCCGPNIRGVAALGNLVYMATLDAKLVALNTKTGVYRTRELAKTKISNYMIHSTIRRAGIAI